MLLGRVRSRATLDLGTFGATPLAMEATFSGNKGLRARTLWRPNSYNSKHRIWRKPKSKGQAAPPAQFLPTNGLGRRRRRYLAPVLGPGEVMTV